MLKVLALSKNQPSNQRGPNSLTEGNAAEADLGRG